MAHESALEMKRKRDDMGDEDREFGISYGEGDIEEEEDGDDNRFTRDDDYPPLDTGDDDKDE